MPLIGLIWLAAMTSCRASIILKVKERLEATLLPCLSISDVIKHLRRTLLCTDRKLYVRTYA